MEYNFDSIVEKIPQVLEFRRKHYYDSLTPLDYPEPSYVWVRDYQGREGIMTYGDFSRSLHRAGNWLNVRISNQKKYGKYGFDKTFREIIKTKFERCKIYENTSRKTLGVPYINCGKK